jgi:hypothetical protein
METSQQVDGQNPPDLILFSGDWDTYQESLYQVFQDTICNANLTFQGLRVSIKRHPEYKEKHFTFWHITSEGEKEEERTPDIRRCERIAWVNWIITNCDKHSGISYWENKRGSQKHVVIWCEEHSYAVVLAKRNGYFLLKTAYHVSNRRADTFRKERGQSQKKRD